MDKLLILNKEGFIPGPNENTEKFFKRVKLTKELFKKKKFFFEKRDQKLPFNMDEKNQI